MSRTKLIILVFSLALLSLLSVTGVYFAHQPPIEEERVTTLCGYEHTGKYDYVAKLKPNNIYNQSTLRPGRGTLYIKIVDHINVTFTYTFECDRPTNTSVECGVNMELESPEKWVKGLTSTLSKTVNLTGESVSTTLFINVTQIEELARLIDEEVGTYSSTYNLNLKPEVHTVAETDMGTIDEVFTPELVIKFNYRTPEGDLILLEGLEHKGQGAITKTEKIHHPNVMNQRYYSYAFFIASISALLCTIGAFTRSKPTAEKPEKPIEEIIAPHEEIIMEAAAEPVYEKQGTTIRMKSLEDLVGVADGLAKPVLYLKRPPSAPHQRPTHIFYVLDGLVKYEYETTAPSRIETKTTVEEESEND